MSSTGSLSGQPILMKSINKEWYTSWHDTFINDNNLQKLKTIFYFNKKGATFMSMVSLDWSDGWLFVLLSQKSNSQTCNSYPGERRGSSRYLKERSVPLKFRQSIVGRQTVVMQGTKIRIIINNGREEWCKMVIYCDQSPDLERLARTEEPQ